METFINNHPFILAEAAVAESLRRNPRLQLHPLLAHAPLLYQEEGQKAMEALYQEFIDIARQADVPIILSSPSWRANSERIQKTKVNQDINGDSIKLLQKLREKQGTYTTQIKIGGLLGCKNDCYLPEEALSEKEAEVFHAWQIDQLLAAKPDFLQAVTLPSVKEARGIAKALSKTHHPYFLSFVIDRHGLILDGSTLWGAIQQIDDLVEYPPVGYMVNCAYPTFICAEQQPESLFERLMGYQANGSSLDHCDLEGAGELHSDDISDWGEKMLDLNRKYGVKVLGGCCGTSPEHLKYLFLANYPSEGIY